MKLTERISKLMVEREQYIIKKADLKESLNDPTNTDESEEELNESIDNVDRLQAQIERQICALLETHVSPPL